MGKPYACSGRRRDFPAVVRVCLGAALWQCGPAVGGADYAVDVGAVVAVAVAEQEREGLRRGSQRACLIPVAFLPSQPALRDTGTMSSNVPLVLDGPLREEPVAQKSFPWHRDAWREQMHDLPDVLDTLEQLPDRVDRQSTRDVVLSELAQGRVLPAFVPAMIWGWGTTGMGPVRTRWVLTQIVDRTAPATNLPIYAPVIDRLEAGSRVVREDEPLSAFTLMNNGGRIKHLGPSYFTKWLYFSSALNGPDDAAAAPILDKQIVSWLYEYAGISLNANKSASYAQYLELLADWGARCERSPVQVEKSIFKLATGRG